MTVVVGLCLGMLTVAALLALLRVAKGPTMLDRVVALDVVVAVVVIALCVEAAANRHATTLPVIVVLALVGFVGAVSVARYAAKEAPQERGER
ncbi:monovalent cation/H+ antiporter complex subunit F [Kineococcus radiotolerans]|uniref:Multiple resistance and pH regulation protein F n=1 Tax=Kineococcus radiotolerans (strain ATCC BAA-149 / DSM 14245 / SRS30216) TaxID=266940 RepID=A6W3Z4_KINRD|nr:monovalent cation/H+ antiporter complex subunit F [Kineococcus radiotolerans]ABS01533.1 multiple resistance and pH regulation protein F [Kineococcus radiotolerans SRS30216 = ATCC BAA-149]